MTAGAGGRNMLVFDTAYTYEMLVTRNIAAIVTGRDHGGWFDHVWTVHPVASLLEPEDSPARFGKPRISELAPRHTIIEGKIGRYRALRRFEKLNFLLAQLGLILLLMRLVRRNQIRIVRSEEIFFCGPMALFLSWWFKIPVLIGVLGNPGNIRKQTGRPMTPRLFKTISQEEAVELFVFKRADMLMVQNEDNRSYCLSRGVPFDRTAIFRVGNLIPAQHFTPPEDRPDGNADLAELGVDGQNTLLCIARLEELKLTDHVIRAVAWLKQNGRHAVALMAGDGSYKPNLEALADDLGVSDRILFIGNRDQQWLSRVIPAVSAVVSPLTGRALAEAALGGAPIAAYDIDWQGEIIETGVTGELVPYLDHGALGAAIERLLGDPERARRMGDAVRARACDMMDPDKADRDQVAVYVDLMRRYGQPV
jgi:glycosyltransferase involved in cell wall biosynthesis